MDVRMFTVGPVDELGLTVEAILVTHCHFDHIGAVAPVAKATGAPVYCPEIEVPVLADIMSFVPWPGFGPYESYEADETVPGGDWGTLLESIRNLVDSHPEETVVYPGHMGITSLAAERATNPFLAELA